MRRDSMRRDCSILPTTKRTQHGKSRRRTESITEVVRQVVKYGQNRVGKKSTRQAGIHFCCANPEGNTADRRRELRARRTRRIESNSMDRRSMEHVEIITEHPRIHRAHGLGRVGTGVSSQPIEQYSLFCECFHGSLCALLALVGRNTRTLHPLLHIPGTLCTRQALCLSRSSVFCHSECGALLPLGMSWCKDASLTRWRSGHLRFSHIVRLNIAQWHLAHILDGGLFEQSSRW